LKNKIILTGLFLTTAISCSAYRPIVLNAYLDPETTTTVDYEDINWSYALFNQYASGLDFKFRLNYSQAISSTMLNRTVNYNTPSASIWFEDWTTITSTYAEGILNDSWRARVIDIFFSREFDRTTKNPITNKILIIQRKGENDTLNFELIIESRISYSVNIGSVYLSYVNGVDAGHGLESFSTFISFYNKDDELQQSFLLIDSLSGSGNNLYGLSTISTNVNRFDLQFRWIDTPPYNPGGKNAFLFIYQFNLFTQNAEISVPDDPEGDVFGFEFVAVEWWNILGHLQNFLWWVVNKSPISPIFVWLDTYVITWVSGLITFITGIFRL
jgi:hypothetical protein